MANDRSKALENYERFAYARDNGHLDFIDKATKCDAYFVGQQWDPAHERRLTRLGKPVITLNKVLSTCASIFGEQLSNRSDVSFRPGRDGTMEVATTLDKMWLQFAYNGNLDWLESEVAADGFIRSRGFFDLRVEFDDQLMGEARLRQLNSKSVVLDPDADSYDPDDWSGVHVTKWLTAADIDRHYGSRYARELKNRPSSAFSHSYDTVDWVPDSFGGENKDRGYDPETERRRMYRVIEWQHKELRWVECFVNPETGDIREIPDNWDRERVGRVLQEYNLSTYRKRVDKIRWTVSLDDILLHDAVSPLKHFTPIPFFPYFRHGTTIGVVENLISPQDLLNKSLSQELHIVNTTANSGWIAKVGTLANMTPEQLEERGGEDGLVILTNSSPKDVVKIQPNQTPQGIDRLSYKADEGLKEVSMVSDSMRGFDRADVAAKAIQAKQARGTVSMAKPFDNLAQTRGILARNVVDIWQEYYTEERVLNITGRNLTDDGEQLTINQRTPEGEVVNDLTLGEYSAVINTVPARESFEQSQYAEAMEMREKGIAIPDDILIESSHLSRKGEIAKRLKEAAGEGEPSQAQQKLQELDMQLKELEAGEKQANIAVKQSNADLNSARADEVRQPDPVEESNQEAEMLQAAMEREKTVAELEIERDKVAEELQQAREKMMADLELAREKLAGEQLLARDRLEIDREAAKSKAALAEKTAAQTAKNAAQTAKTTKTKKE